MAKEFNTRALPTKACLGSEISLSSERDTTFRMHTVYHVQFTSTVVDCSLTSSQVCVSDRENSSLGNVSGKYPVGQKKLVETGEDAIHGGASLF